MLLLEEIESVLDRKHPAAKLNSRYTLKSKRPRAPSFLSDFEKAPNVFADVALKKAILRSVFIGVGT